MGKRIIARYINDFKKFVQSSSIELADWQVQELIKFRNEIGYTSDRRKTLLQFVKLGYKNWSKIWQVLKSMHNSSLKYQKILHGKVNGTARYQSINVKKRQALPTTIDYYTSRGIPLEDAVIEIKKIQKSRNERAVSVITARPHASRSCRQVGWWIDRGFDPDRAVLEVKRVQTTNGYNYCGDIKQQERNTKWQNSIKSNPNNNDIGYKRSHSLKRYIDRAGGNEIAGYAAYCNYRLNLSGWHSASKQSMAILQPIIDLCRNIGADCYYGADGSHEWILRHVKKAFLYDLTIPLFSIIVEFNGEAWHPNPSWNKNKWDAWKHPHTKETADERHLKDNLKIQAAVSAGWDLYVIWDSSPDITQILEKIETKAQKQNL